MKYSIVILGFYFLACTNAGHDHTKKADDHQQQNSTSSLQLNNGAKWKIDDATRKNVTAITQIANDSNYYKNNAASFVQEFQAKIDTLVQQCRMTGADHEALHLWLEKLLHDFKELKENKNEPQQALINLQKTVLLFDDYFE